MKRVLLTGMSGTGKSTVINELAARGYKAVDTDDHGLSDWVAVPWRSQPVDTSAPLDQVVASVLRLVQSPSGRSRTGDGTRLCRR
jgi:septin family protein